MSKKYTVIKDTREQLGWIFTPSVNCDGMDHQTMKTGDYTIVGYEHLLTVERKGSVAEFAANVLQKRFEAELIRMESFKYKYVILEFDMLDILTFPMTVDLPAYLKARMKTNGYLILKKMLEFEIKYGVIFMLVGVHGKEVAASIFKRVIEAENK